MMICPKSQFPNCSLRGRGVRVNEGAISTWAQSHFNSKLQSQQVFSISSQKANIGCDITNWGVAKFNKRVSFRPCKNVPAAAFHRAVQCSINFLQDISVHSIILFTWTEQSASDVFEAAGVNRTEIGLQAVFIT